jgi:hypothetical protein
MFYDACDTSVCRTSEPSANFQKYYEIILHYRLYPFSQVFANILPGAEPGTD